MVKARNPKKGSCNLCDIQYEYACTEIILVHGSLLTLHSATYTQKLRNVVNTAHENCFVRHVLS